MSPHQFPETIVAPPNELIKCPVDSTFRIIGKKFTVLILRNMIYAKQKHFNEFLNTIEGINANTLSTRLREMEKNNLVERKIFHETPVRIEYHLSEKGKDLSDPRTDGCIFNEACSRNIPGWQGNMLPTGAASGPCFTLAT